MEQSLCGPLKGIEFDDHRINECFCFENDMVEKEDLLLVSHKNFVTYFPFFR